MKSGNINILEIQKDIIVDLNCLGVITTGFLGQCLIYEIRLKIKWNSLS